MTETIQPDNRAGVGRLREHLGKDLLSGFLVFPRNRS